MKPLCFLPATPVRSARGARSWWALLALPLVVLSACRDAEVTAYRIPKEKTAGAAAAGAHAATAPAPQGMAAGMDGLAVTSSTEGGLTWTAPTAWKIKAGSAMRKGSYTIGAEGGPTADLAITAFPGNVGGDLANVNRWLGQLGSPPIAESELAKVLAPLTSTEGVAMQVVDLAGGTAEQPLRMLGAIVPHGQSTWFFKLVGPDAVVAPEKVTFLAFLKTVKLGTPPAAVVADPAPNGPATMTPSAASPMMPAANDMSGATVTAAEGANLKWVAPPNWQQKTVSSMRKATFIIPGANGSSAELAVTAFPGDVGGDLANLNRWRGQLSLPPVDQAEFARAVTRLQVGSLAVTVVDVTGGTADSPTRLLGAMVPYAGATWFFKMTGPTALVGAEKTAFLAFLQTLSTP